MRSSSSMAVLVSLLAVLAAVPVSAQLDRLLQQLPKSGAGASLSDAKIGDGLKQALQVATENAVGLTGKTDGYFGTRRSRS
jgi:hypothetical protein